MCFSKYFFYIIIFFFLLFFSFTEATVRYVSKTGNSTPPYLTWETAADSIQKCIDICVFGDTIYVANGVYEEQVIMIPGLSLIGAGMDSCIIDTRALVTTIDFTSVTVADSCLFTGFNIWVYYNSSTGYGIKNSGNGDCLITMNKITQGALGTFIGEGPTVYKNIYDNLTIGIWLFSSSSVVRKNIISTPNISGAEGIDIEATSNNYNPVIDSNYIETFRDGIRKSFGSRPIIANNKIVLKLVGARGISLSFSDSAFVYNNLIYVESGFRGIDNYAVQHLFVYNNYITGNFYDSPDAGAIIVGPDNVVKNNVVVNVLRGIGAWGNENLVVQYNDLWNNGISNAGFTLDTTNLSVDPMVVNDDTTQGELDFHLQKYSPLIDAGDPSILDKDSSRSDIGLYGGLWGESYKYVDYPPRAPRNLNAVVDTNNNSIININWNRNTEADFDYYNLYSDTSANFTTDTTNFVASTGDTSYLYQVTTTADSLYFKLTGVDSQRNVSIPSEEAGVLLVTGVEGEWKPISSFILYQNYPNPFNPSTKIGYKLRERGYVKLYVYDIKGELVSVLVNKEQNAGYYEIEFSVGQNSSSDLASGVYIYQILVKNEKNIPVFSDIKKMILIK